MAGPTAIRRIRNPVLALPPSEVRIRTRIRPTGEEAATLTAIGDLLGSAFRSALAGRIRLGRLDGKRQALWRADRKQALTRAWSSRRAGAINRGVKDQFQLGMRGLAAHVADLRAAVEVLQQRCALRPNDLAGVIDDGEAAGGGGPPAANTVRVAPTQNSILLANQERLSHLAPRLRL